MTVQVSSVDLYWLPLGAGGHSVRLNGRVFEGWRRGSAGGLLATSTTPHLSCGCRRGGS